VTMFLVLVEYFVLALRVHKKKND